MSLSAAIGVFSGFNECVTFFQWAKSAISSLHSRWSGSQDQTLQDRVFHLESGLQRLRDTLPAMYDLINKAEWRSHDDGVGNLLPNLKDAVAEAEDLLDEFRWYEKKVQVEGNASQSPCFDFFDTFAKGSFNKLNDVQLRLNHLSSQMENMGLRGVTQRFDKLVRPETTSLPNETKIFGRDKELKQVLGFLNVPTDSKRKRANSSANSAKSASGSNQVSNISRISSLPVLPIVGIGGVGKSTLAQHICNHQRVKSHFEQIIWICVSDDFDVKRLTKEVLQSCTGKDSTTDNLDSLQRALSNHVNNIRLLIVLDDMWGDALKENGQCWRRFCAPFRSVQEGSAMLVTTRCPTVAEGVRTMESVILEGLKDDIFWNFFNLCAFGHESSNNDPELERIGRRILPKLKGSPLAAKTLGRMLSMNLQASHWSSILESELWELRQEETDILPALRLSFMYLPFYLKRCFSFCAVYPKDYKFEKARLAEIWAAEGFVDPQGGVPIQDIGCQYFEDLVTRSFFQKVSSRYVIHDLLHDMAQMVSEHDCFILRNKSDFDKVRQTVRHLYVLPSSDFDDSNLLRLCKFTKLRTLICEKNLGKRAGFVMDHWGTKLLRMRVISCAFTNELPDSIGNWKHLRYLEISRACPFNRIPSTFCGLYNMQTLYTKKCKLESLPSDFGKLISLQKFESHGLQYYAGDHMTLDPANRQGRAIRLINNLNQFRGHLEIANGGMLSKNDAVEAELKNKKYLEELTLNMNSSQTIQDNVIDLSLNTNFRRSPTIQENEIELSLNTNFQRSQTIQENEIELSLNTNSQRSQTIQDIAIDLSLNTNFRRPQTIQDNQIELSPNTNFQRSQTIQENVIELSPNTNFQSPQTIQANELEVLEVLQPPISLKSLLLQKYTGVSLPSWFQPQNLPSLKSLTFQNCVGLGIISSPMMSQSINLNEIPAVGIFMSLTDLTIDGCENISSLDRFLHPDYVPAIKKIRVENCKVLASIPTEMFGDLHFLEELDVVGCPNIRSQRLVSPSLKKLSVHGSSLFCNIDCCSLTYFHLESEFVTSIQLQMWSLPALQDLQIIRCESLTSIEGSTDLSISAATGRLRAFPSLNVLSICTCEKLSTLGDFLTQEYVPAIEKIEIQSCRELLYLAGERLGSLTYLKHLLVSECPNLNWQRGLLLPSSLQRLSLRRCGDISPYVSSCLQNLTALVTLRIDGCKGITSIPGEIWRGNLVSLVELVIQDCPDLVSVGGARAVAKIKKVWIYECRKFKEADEINRRFPSRWMSEREAYRQARRNL